MADSPSRQTEHLDKSHLEGRPQRLEKPEHQDKTSAKELQKTASEFEEGVSEVADLMNNAEVAEKAGEDKKKGPAGTFKTGTAKTSTQAIKPLPLKIPKIDTMQAQISKEIRKQIHALEHEAKKIMMNPTAFSPFKLNGLVGKIRELKYILANLAHATFETLKGWWMKFVRNISI